MKMWSKGLGKIELVVDFSHYRVVKEEEETVIKGTTNEPVQWEFKVMMDKQDIAGVLNVFFKPTTLLFVIKNIGWIFKFFIEKLTNSEKYSEEEAI